MSQPAFEDELVDLAATVLRGAGYSIDSLDLPELLDEGPDGSPASESEKREPVAPRHRHLALAQNRFFVVAVGAAATLREVETLEGLASTELSRLMSSSHLGGKQWDVYLVLLARQELPDEGEAATQLAEINHNTRFFRRMARAGVRPDLDDVRRSLRPFLPLAATEQPDVLADALTLLERELPAHGVDRQTAGRAIAAFRETGSLSSV